MGLIKWDFFSNTIAPPRSRKHIPTPIWVQEKNRRRLVKIEETYQEEVFHEETYQEEVSQEGMATPIDDTIAQKIFKAIEEQSDALKKIGGHLSKLEESKLKKAIHVEIHNEDEREDWDENNKAKCERNKQFEKLTANTMAIKEKMGKMQLAFRKAQGMDDCLYNMGGVGSKTPIALPPKFKISNMEKYDGTGDPKQHIRRYLSIVINASRQLITHRSNACAPLKCIHTLCMHFKGMQAVYANSKLGCCEKG